VRLAYGSSGISLKWREGKCGILVSLEDRLDEAITESTDTVIENEFVWEGVGHVY